MVPPKRSAGIARKEISLEVGALYCTCTVLALTGAIHCHILFRMSSPVTLDEMGKGRVANGGRHSLNHRPLIGVSEGGGGAKKTPTSQDMRLRGDDGALIPTALRGRKCQAQRSNENAGIQRQAAGLARRGKARPASCTQPPALDQPTRRHNDRV